MPPTMIRWVMARPCGAIVGAAFGAVVCGVTIIGIPLIPLCMLGPAFQGALVGLIVGAVAPDVIPQVLP